MGKANKDNQNSEEPKAMDAPARADKAAVPSDKPSVSTLPKLTLLFSFGALCLSGAALWVSLTSDVGQNPSQVKAISAELKTQQSTQKQQGKTLAANSQALSSLQNASVTQKGQGATLAAQMQSLSGSLAKAEQTASQFRNSMDAEQTQLRLDMKRLAPDMRQKLTNEVTRLQNSIDVTMAKSSLQLYWHQVVSNVNLLKAESSLKDAQAYLQQRGADAAKALTSVEALMAQSQTVNAKLDDAHLAQGLSTLQTQIKLLPFKSFKPKVQTKAKDTTTPANDVQASWWKKSVDSSLDKLKSLVVVSHGKTVDLDNLDEHFRARIYETAQITIEQIKLAALQGNSKDYKIGLSNLAELVTRYYDSAKSSSVLASIQTLEKTWVTPAKESLMGAYQKAIETITHIKEA